MKQIIQQAIDNAIQNMLDSGMSETDNWNNSELLNQVTFTGNWSEMTQKEQKETVYEIKMLGDFF